MEEAEVEEGGGSDPGSEDEMEGSVVSSVTDKYEPPSWSGQGGYPYLVCDRYGFLAGDCSLPGPHTAVDLELLRRREGKWVEMLGSWDRAMLHQYSKVRERCRKGIPPSMWARAWLHLCGAKFQMEAPANRFYTPYCIHY